MSKNSSNDNTKPIRSLGKRLRYGFEWLVLILARDTLRMLPHDKLFSLSKFFGKLAFIFDKRGRETAIENLRVAFGERFTPDQRRAIALESYQHFSRAFMDLFWSPNINEENFHTLVSYEFDDERICRKAIDNGAICLTPHYSNFEWLALCYAYYGTPVTIIAQDFKNPYLTKVFRDFRELSGHQVIPQERAMIRLLKLLKSGKSTALLPDLKMPPSNFSVVSEIFGLPVSSTPLHAVLAKRTDAPLLPAICIPNPDGTYRMRVLKPIEFTEDASIEEIVQGCWDVFEPIISEQPAPWLWMYKHWRYKALNYTKEFPNYANNSSAFNKMLNKAKSTN